MRATETEGKWRERVAEWRASGQTAAEYCAERGLSVGTLRWWSSRLKRKGRPGRASSPTVRLAQVVRSPAAPPARGAVVVELRDARARITIEAGVDPETLAVVLAAIDAGGAR
jgi:transposase